MFESERGSVRWRSTTRSADSGFGGASSRSIPLWWLTISFFSRSASRSGSVMAFTTDVESSARSRKTRSSPNWRLASKSATLRLSRLPRAMAVLMAIVVVPTPPFAP